MVVFEQEKARIVSSATAGVALITSVTVVSQGATDAHSVVTMTYATVATTSQPVVNPLRGEEYPSLVAIWDNDDDAIYDQI